MADNPTDTLDAQDRPATTVPDIDAELDDLPDEPELSREERIASIRRGMADFEAGRYRPAKDVLRELAAEDGIILPE